MVEALDGFLRANPVALLFVILGVGYLIGKTSVRGFELGAVTGVLFAGLLFGHLGYQISRQAQTFGFVMFMFSVGFQAGPGFFEVIRRDGAKYFVLALVVALAGFGLSAWLARLLAFPVGASAGLLAGALTTTPTLAAAQDALQSGAVALPPGTSVDDAVRNLTTSYAITYLFGLVGLILVIRTAPRLLGLDLPAEAEKLGGGPLRVEPAERISVRAYRVEVEELVGIPLRELRQQLPPGAGLVRLRRRGEYVGIAEETALALGDEVAISGKLHRFVDAASRLGPELTDAELLDTETESARVVVTRRDAVGLTLEQLDVPDTYGCFLTDMRRLGEELPIEPSLALQRGDVLSVTGPSSALDRLGEELGHVERSLVETDLLTLALGIVAGLLIGTLSITIGDVPVGLGAAGGLLTMGLLVGYLRSIHPTFGRLPEAARWTFMELGLQMFMAGVGVSAGAGILETLTAVGPSLVLCGIGVTLAPVLVGWVVGRHLLRLNPALLLGAITGSMTSGAALSVVNAAARSSAPALGYTGAYAFANVILTFAGTLIVRL